MAAKTQLFAALIAMGSIAAVATTGTFAIVDRRAEQSTGAGPQASPAANTFVASIQTQWLSPEIARRSLDERSATLTAWSNARGGSLHVLSSTNLLRTHTRDGARLVAPVARFERVVEIRLPGELDVVELQRALSGANVTILR